MLIHVCCQCMPAKTASTECIVTQTASHSLSSTGLTSFVGPSPPPTAQSHSDQTGYSSHSSSACIHQSAGCICSRRRHRTMCRSSYCSPRCALWPCHKLDTACSFSAQAEDKSLYTAQNYQCRASFGRSLLHSLLSVH